MYVVSIPNLLELDQLYPHQIMVEKGLVHEWTEGHGVGVVLWKPKQMLELGLLVISAH